MALTKCENSLKKQAKHIQETYGKDTAAYLFAKSVLDSLEKDETVESLAVGLNLVKDPEEAFYESLIGEVEDLLYDVPNYEPMLSTLHSANVQRVYRDTIQVKARVAELGKKPVAVKITIKAEVDPDYTGAL